MYKPVEPVQPSPLVEETRPLSGPERPYSHEDGQKVLIVFINLPEMDLPLDEWTSLLTPM